MSTRREPEQNRLEKIGTRVRQRALTGTEASTVGFTLVVFIFAGAGLGYLLDKNLETSYWIAIGTLLGAAVGFRQMFAITKKLTRESAYDDTDDSTSNEVVESPSPAPQARRSPSIKEPQPQLEHPPRRLFSTEVPPPPVSSFDTRPVENQEQPAGEGPEEDKERPA